ncbi:3-keto-5-aminohexanoate cleavage protein [Streptomyces sp. SID8352]|uniref:3-keto-5-aminohexanoate cleavage protein n=1 Tax=Streptomyces sp. SID8352 TaxID=2690338 RepID=UPI00136E50F9|nr:3-keto-5-aminohexanoate cleavage protein [Streptomyces sp. SID8352]MYU22002.1 3-keto-5-aminohexanoate cleavage protein [Streptomyces sp. SID8352]
MAKRKVIISAAVTGSIHTPSMSPYLPVTAKEIGTAAIQAAEAGAAIVHLHARDPEQGQPSQDPKLYEPFLTRIGKESDVVVNITTGGNPLMTLEERLAPVATFQPELASLNMGSINFAMYPMLQRFTEFKYDWERPYLESSKDFVFRNTFGDIERILEKGAASGTRFEHECYDIAHIYSLAHFMQRDLISGPLLVQSVFGILGGIGVHPEDVTHMRRTADRLLGDEYQWSVLGGGRHQIPIATMALAMGSHVRVGLEDSLWLGPGELANSSAAQVTKIRAIIEELGMEVATPDEARAILQLKGRDKVAF